MRFYANDPYANYGGMRVIEDWTMIEQFRHPRSKGKRIKKKFKKNPNNYRPKRHAWIDQRTGAVFCHPLMAQELRRQIKRAI